MLASLCFAAATACRDPDVGPPPRKLNAEQAAKVETARLSARPVPRHLSSATFGGGAVAFLGADARPDIAQRGKALTVSLYFEVIRPLDKSWKLFVHVEGGDGDGMLANVDHIPVDGLYPTDRWKAGELLEDRFTFTVPPTAPETLAVRFGFYRFNDRLPVDARETHDGANRVIALRIPVSSDGPSLPVYRAARRKGPIVIDGKVDDAGWQGVAGSGPFARSFDGGEAAFRTEAWLTWDEQNLYAAFRVQDDDVWAKLSRDDDPIYTEEVVEIFLDADGDGKTYNELEVSPGNVKFDAYFPARRQGMDLAWNSGMETAVQVQGMLNNSSDRDAGWTAELRIPVANLAKVPRWPPEPGDRWRFNLYRLERRSGREEGYAFSPLFVGDFHHLPRFGVLEFAP